MKTVVGMFNDFGEAQRTFDELLGLGFGPNEISVVTNPDVPKPANARMKLFAVDAPDTGRVAACGPVATVLARDGGGLMTTLRNAGVAPALAEHYVKAIRQGETLESLIVEDKDADRVVATMQRHAARYGAAEPSTETRSESRGVKGVAAGAIAGTAAAAGAVKAAVTGTVERAKESIEGTSGRGAERKIESKEDGDRYIPVLREELQVGKREVERGGVHVDVRVTERPVSAHILLREEHVDIERRATDRAPRPEEAVFRGGEVDMIEHGEDIIVSKQVHVVEEVLLRKRVTEHDEVINDKVRSTDVEIDQLAGDRKAYRAHFDAMGNKGNFSEWLPAYEYGRSMRRSRTDRWEDIEGNGRTEWEAKRPGTWDSFRDAIHHAWSRARLP